MKTLTTVTLNARGKSVLWARVAKLNKRATRYGMNSITLRVISEEPIERAVKVNGITQFVPDIEYVVEINGCEPCINGWKLVARVEFDACAGTLVHIVPGHEDNDSYAQYRTIGPVCEHCHVARKRNDVFVLENQEGVRRIIGRNCLADYLRSGNAADLARWAEFMGEIEKTGSDGGDGDSEYERGGHVNSVMSLSAYLRVVAVAKRRFGWLGRVAARDADGVATADTAIRILFGRGAGHERWLAENELFASSDDAEYVEKAIEWAGSDDENPSEYRYIIRKLALAGSVDMSKHAGYAASILIAYDKHLEREVEYAARVAGMKEKVYIGSPKKRIRNLSVKCVGVSTFEGYYGVTTIVRFEHYPDGPDGNTRAILVWFASGDKCYDWNVDEDYVIDATVKAHDDHEKYGKQTKINRVKGL